ncbi:thiamine ABC transporter substrate binding subunit [Cocleimonas flava]|uniref:Thiamine transport system substrate-binding protein n=1 Tax=Cocleimonas flava TaxID=634765 RepID=A0A4R1F4G0_9GAMM|nr:thiamine ABC transporter substrate binding subunit [Cocleimonas flava]TCJ88230.1 thiamine transport system substrate-binding protein [Cocleimonas flava]
MRFFYSFICFTLLSISIPVISAESADKPTLNVYTYDSFTSDWGPGPKVKKAFEEVCNCTLNYVALEDGVSLLSRLKLEGRHTKADIVLGLDTNLIANAEATGYFAPHEMALENSTLPEKWTNSHFIPYDFGYFAFVYDKDKLKNPPTSLKALIENPDSPKILIQDPRTSTPGLGLLLWVKKVYGDKAEEAWEKLAPRIVTVSKGWSEAYGLFLKDQAPLVLSYTTSPAYHMIAEKKNNFAAAKFSEGHYQQIEVAGMIAASKNKELAKKFLDFIQGETFQKIIPTTNWMYPAALDKTELPEAFNTLIDPEPALIFSSDEVNKNRKAWVSEWLNALAK